ncbi:MAG TPA: CvpA family protein [Terriglobales bacterium]|nr:CvpA family protein [Terriglobales bacterium]
MNALDYIIIVVVVLSTLAALAQGFLREAFSLAGVVVGYIVAAWQYWRVSAWLLPYVKTAWVADLAGFLIIFIAVATLAGVTGRIARGWANEAGLGWADRFLGGAFGLLRGLLAVMVVLLGIAAFQPTTGLLTQSQLAPYFLVIGRGASWLAPSAVRQQFRAGVAALRNVQQQHEQAH